MRALQWLCVGMLQLMHLYVLSPACSLESPCSVGQCNAVRAHNALADFSRDVVNRSSYDCLLR
eukprot:m.119676 g.119676  ORF g.119676 m.119676 type:complete len:63 (+) comp13678_c2_seq8:1241-1429(+)